MFKDILGDTHICGEIQNSGDAAADALSVKAMFYESCNALIGSSVGYTLIEPRNNFVLLPTGKAPFDIELMADETLRPVDHYSLSASFQDNPEGKPTKLNITSTDFHTVRYARSVGSFVNVLPVYVTVNRVANGTIVNLGPKTSESTQVWVTFYDENGVVCFVKHALMDQPDLNSGESTTFTAEAFEARSSLQNLPAIE